MAMKRIGSSVIQNKWQIISPEEQTPEKHLASYRSVETNFQENNKRKGNKKKIQF